MMKMMITLMATAVLFAITTNVAEAAKVNPNPVVKPSTGGIMYGTSKKCVSVRVCVKGNYTREDLLGCAPRGKYLGSDCRKGNQKERCKAELQKCKDDKKKKKKAKKTLPSTTGTIMNTVPMQQYKMAPTKQNKKKITGTRR